MSINILENFLPENTLPFLKIWFGEYNCHLKITKNRNSKLGDYRKLPDKTHQITINGTLEPQLFFFVLTHELAHLLHLKNMEEKFLLTAKNGNQTFREMLIESIEVYQEDLKLIIKKFSKSPKANFMASPELVKYFHKEEEGFSFVENLEIGTQFIFKEETYIIKEKIKKRYLCKNLSSNREYYSNLLQRLKNCRNMNKNNYCVIMAGGIGSRFWPCLPKNSLNSFKIFWNWQNDDSTNF
jgi:hypothetical protein